MYGREKHEAKEFQRIVATNVRDGMNPYDGLIEICERCDRKIEWPQTESMSDGLCEECWINNK